MQNPIASLVAGFFPKYGVNKKREISRLVYEISRRENIPPAAVLSGCENKQFSYVKKALIKRRYPQTCGFAGLSSYSFPELPEGAPRRTGSAAAFSPQIIYVDSKSSRSPVAVNAARLFPNAEIREEDSLKTIYKKLSASPFDYDARLNALVIGGEEYDFVKPCPCTRQAVCCGYSVANMGFGCIYNCAYCFLQAYQNLPAIMLPSNPERIADKIKAVKCPAMRVGSGEFSDSLALDHIAGYSRVIVEELRSRPDIVFEFKTKSANIDNLLTLRHGGNVVVSWSVNPPGIISRHESAAAVLEDRLAAAGKCAAAGYKVGFHFDPIIHYPGWEGDYARVVDGIFKAVPAGVIAWISLGTLRFVPKLQRVMESRFTDTSILNGEFITGFDGKLRYPDAVRSQIYKTMTGFIRARSGSVVLYLCMEDKNMWRAAGAGLSLP